jgi:hypothetical protein
MSTMDLWYYLSLEGLILTAPENYEAYMKGFNISLTFSQKNFIFFFVHFALGSGRPETIISKYFYFLSCALNFKSYNLFQVLGMLNE